MKKVFVISLLCLGTFYGCKKEQSGVPTPSSNSQTTALRENNWDNLCDIPNSNNDYDSAGYRHNRMVAICEDAGHFDMSIEQVYNLTDSILQIEYDDNLVSGFSSESYATPILDSFQREVSIRNYINDLETTTLQKDELQNLLEIMLTYDGTNLCDVINEIKSFENNLLAVHNGADIKIVLIASSVGRYSLAYWHTRLDDGTGQKTTGFWKKFFIGACDAIGAAGGALAGSATVLGGIAGGVVGGIAASNGAATLWNHFAN